MKIFFTDFKNIDKSNVKIRTIGTKFSFILCLFFTYILFCYSIHPISQIAYSIGYLGIKLSLSLIVSFFVSSFAVDKIKNNSIH